MYGKISHVKVISWGLAGVSYDYQQEGYGNCSCSTYLSAVQFFEELKINPRENTIFTGAWVLDKEKILDNISGLCVRSPLIDVNADPDSYEYSWNKWKKFDGDFTKITSLTYVGVNVYVTWWRLSGAKVGKMINEFEVKWEV